MKKWKKLVTLGCSLAPIDHWPKEIAKYIGLADQDDWAHYGFGGSGNHLLMHLWHDYFLKNDLSDTLVVWEITGLERFSGVWDLSETQQKKLDKDRMFGGVDCGYWMQFKSFYDNSKKFGVYGNSRHFKNLEIHIENPDLALVYAQLTTTLCTIPCDTLIFRGWSGAVKDEYWKKSTPIFEKYGKHVVKEPYVDWVVENDYPMMEDGFHPEVAAGKEWFNQILKLYLDKIQ